MHRHQDPMGPDGQGDVLGADYNQSTVIYKCSLGNCHRSALRHCNPTANALASTRQYPHAGDLDGHSRPWFIRMHCGSRQSRVHVELRQERRLPVGLAQHHHLVCYRAEHRDYGCQSSMPEASLQIRPGKHLRAWHSRIEQCSTPRTKELARATRFGAEGREER